MTLAGIAKVAGYEIPVVEEMRQGVESSMQSLGMKTDSSNANDILAGIVGGGIVRAAEKMAAKQAGNPRYAGFRF